MAAIVSQAWDEDRDFSQSFANLLQRPSQAKVRSTTQRLANPIAEQMSHMRPSLPPGLLHAARRNHDRGYSDIALFEVGQVFSDNTPEGQKTCAGGVRGSTQRLGGGGRHWRGGTRAVDVFDVKADALSLIEATGLYARKVQIIKGAPSWFHPGRSGVIQLGPQRRLGAFGEVHPGIVQALDMSGSPTRFINGFTTIYVTDFCVGG